MLPYCNKPLQSVLLLIAVSLMSAIGQKFHDMTWQLMPLDGQGMYLDALL